eukprot:5905315-Lingulodinium_polyedra.AAC.1
MREEDRSVAALRRRCRNTLFVAGAILSRDGLQELTKVMFLLTRPYWTSHSHNEATVRGPAASVQFFLEAARGEWKSVLYETVLLLSDPAAPASVGFETVFDAPPDNLGPADTR